MFVKFLRDPHFRSKLIRWLLNGQSLRWMWGNLKNQQVCLFNILLSPRVGCFICGWSGREFLSVVSPWTYRPRAVCPGCGSMERHRALARLIKTRNLLQAGDRCLGVALEQCMEAYLRLHGVWVTSVDLGSIPAASRMDVRALAFSGGVFDVVLCSHVLEYVKEWKQGLGEIHRVLRGNGTLLLTENYHFGQPETIEFDVRDLIGGTPLLHFGSDLPRALTETGFQVEPYDYLHKNDSRGDWFFICRKTA